MLLIILVFCLLLYFTFTEPIKDDRIAIMIYIFLIRLICRLIIEDFNQHYTQTRFNLLGV